MFKGMLALVLSFGLFISGAAHAASAQAVNVRILFSAATLSDLAYTQAIASTGRIVKGFSAFSTSQNPIAVAIGGSGSEVKQVIIPQGTLGGGVWNGSPVGAYNGNTTFFPLTIAYGQRVSLVALNSAVNTGELQLNFFYQ